MTHRSHVRAIADRSAAQLGLVTTAQLTSLGVSEQVRRSLEAHRTLERVGARVWRLAGHPVSWRQQLLAATLEAGPGAVVSHLAACALWRLDGIAPGAVEVTVPRGRRPRRVAGIVHRSRDLLAVDVHRGGVPPVTTPSRSLIDAAAVLDRDRLAAALDGATRSGLVHVPYLQWRIEELRRHGRPGIGRIAAVVPAGTAREREESWLERRATQAIRAAGLPPPRSQVRLRHRRGRARVDLCYDETRLVVEVDGHATHATRRERQADAERAAGLVAAGWRVVRFTYEDVVDRPAYLAATIRTLLGLDGALVGT
ncbi:MAG TPA: DUF559 domain-containing protein [Acidimicrobiales bacterium]|nr:DUF559 domain-containing protein [Acidimicrobiales bacterium]